MGKVVNIGTGREEIRMYTNTNKKEKPVALAEVTRPGGGQ